MWMWRSTTEGDGVLMRHALMAAVWVDQVYIGCNVYTQQSISIGAVVLCCRAILDSFVKREDLVVIGKLEAIFLDDNHLYQRRVLQIDSGK